MKSAPWDSTWPARSAAGGVAGCVVVAVPDGWAARCGDAVASGAALVMSLILEYSLVVDLSTGSGTRSIIDQSINKLLRRYPPEDTMSTSVRKKAARKSPVERAAEVTAA